MGAPAVASCRRLPGGMYTSARAANARGLLSRATALSTIRGLLCLCRNRNTPQIFRIKLNEEGMEIIKTVLQGIQVAIMAVAMWVTLSQLREIQEDNRLQGLSSIRQDYLTHRNDFYSWVSGPWAEEELLRTTHEEMVDRDSVPHSLEWQFQTRLMGMLDNIEHAATLVEQGMLPEEHAEIIQRHIREDVRRILSFLEYDPVSGILHISTDSQVQWIRTGEDGSGMQTTGRWQPWQPEQNAQYPYTEAMARRLRLIQRTTTQSR